MPDTAGFDLRKQPLQQRILDPQLFIVGTISYQVIDPSGLYTKLFAIPGQQVETSETAHIVLVGGDARAAILGGKRFEDALAGEIDQIRPTKAIERGHWFERPPFDQRHDLLPIVRSVEPYEGVVHLTALRALVIKMSRHDRTQPAVRQRILRSSSNDC